MVASERSAQAGTAPLCTIIHRKTELGRAKHQARAMSLAKALRLTLAKVADDLFEMPMSVIGVRRQTCNTDALMENFKAPGLRMLLEGPGHSRAAAVFDSGLVTGLIQQQTMGKVLPPLDGDARNMTPTDAAISAPFLDALLSRTAPVPEDPADQRLIEGFGFGAWVEDVRVLCMALEEPVYELIHIDIDIAGGVCQGHILLCMPKDRAPTHGSEDTAITQTDEGADLARLSAATLSDTVMSLHANLLIFIAQIKMPLRSLGALKPDDMIELGIATLEAVRIQSSTGAKVGRGVLGQLDGVRAVQVQSTKTQNAPLTRRASDRDDLALADVTKTSGDSVPDTASEFSSLPDMDSPPDLPDLPGFSDSNVASDMPDMSDLPDFDGLPDMPDLPDMSDLPDFGDETVQPKSKAG